FFYYGLKQLTGLPLFHITFEGVINKSIVIKHKKNIRVLVDCRIFYSGKWRGYKMLRKSLNMISQWIWLDVSGGGRFYPKGCDYDIYVNMQGNVKKNIEKLYFAFLKKNVSRIVNHYPRLTKKEQIVLQCLLKSKGGDEIKNQLKIEEKTLSCYRSKITRKFGCKGYIRFMYLYSLNKEMVDERCLMPGI
ncbi:TPA: response regulator, partial [Klebsiella pneumoniae]|nr:response regulator [Klebsiella pneumoniae]HBV2374494.1 response regulator [Klebsiella pneumoniae]